MTLFEHIPSVAPLMGSYLLGLFTVFSASAFIEKKLGHETFLGYGLDFLISVPVVFMITLITYVELTLLLWTGLELLNILPSSNMILQISIGFIAGFIHISVLIVLSATSLLIAFRRGSYTEKYDFVFDIASKLIIFIGGVPLLYLVALFLT